MSKSVRQLTEFHSFCTVLKERESLYTLARDFLLTVCGTGELEDKKHKQTPAKHAASKHADDAPSSPRAQYNVRWEVSRLIIFAWPSEPT